MKQIKKIAAGATAMLLAAALLFPSAASAADIRDFYDVRNHWSYESVQFCVEQGLFSGVSAHRFAPNDILSRAMFVSVLSRLALQFSYTEQNGVLSHPSAPSVQAAVLFPDVPPTAWYAASVAWAVDAGILSGYSDGGFHPDEAIPREQMAVIVCAFFEKIMQTKLTQTGTVSFRDADSVSEWAKEAVLTVGSAGIIVGNEKGQFSPADVTTRGAAAVVLRRVFDNCSRIRQNLSYATGSALTEVYQQSFSQTPSAWQTRSESGSLSVGRKTYKALWTAEALSCKDDAMHITLSQQGDTLLQGGFSIPTDESINACYAFRCTVPTQSYGAVFRCGIRIGSLSVVPFESHAWGDAVKIRIDQSENGTVLYERTLPGLRALTDGAAHTYAVVILKDGCAFYIDGVLACRYTGDVPDAKATVFCEAEFRADEGLFFPTLLPMVFSVDAVTVYGVS